MHWVRPETVVDVAFTEWTTDGALRHPVFRGVRDDREPDEIRLPSPEERAAGEAAAGRAGSGRAGSGGSEGSGAGSEAHGSGARGSGADGSGAHGSGSGGSGAGGSGSGRRGGSRAGADVAGVRLTHPDRVLYPEQGVTKLALARYYEEVAEWILPHLAQRPLSLVRCPQGRETTCFYQKHPGEGMASRLPRVGIEEKDGTHPYLYVRSLADLVALVQAGVLELHVWGSRIDDIERPDLLVFDLDPAEDVAWRAVLHAARELRERLDALGLAAFVRTTGGKGLHVVVPLEPRRGWDDVKAFARGVAEAHAARRAAALHDQHVEGQARRPHLPRLPPQRPGRDRDRLVLDPGTRRRAGGRAAAVGRARPRDPFRPLPRRQRAPAAGGAHRRSVGGLRGGAPPAHRRDAAGGGGNVSACVRCPAAGVDATGRRRAAPGASPEGRRP